MEDLLLLLGVLLIILSLFMLMRKRMQRRRGGKNITAREQLERMKDEKAVRGDLQQLMVELEQLTRRFSAQLDAKAVHLEKLLREADQRIDRLEQLQQVQPPAQQDHAPSLQLHGAVEPQPAQAEPPAPDEPHDEQAQFRRSVYELADQGLEPLQIAQKLDEHIGKIELMLALRST